MAVTIRLRYVLLAVFGLLAVQAATIPIAISLAQQGEAPGPRASSPLGLAFTHQGRIVVDGIPAEGPHDFEFRLWDQAVGGTQIGATIPADDLAVTNGLYSINLDFGAEPFQGSQRYLEVKVKPGTGGSFALLDDRQALTATPYALYSRTTAPHSHFGASWAGFSPVGEAGLSVSNFTEDSYGIAGYGGTGGAGVYGAAPQFGCTFSPLSDLCYGVIGDASQAANLGGVGVLAKGTNTGLWAQATAGGSGYAGVLDGRVLVREGTTGSPPLDAAVYAENGNEDSIGVKGKGTNAGVFGIGPTDIGGPTAAGVVGQGLYGVAGDGELAGVFGKGERGVWGYSSVSAFGDDAAVVGINDGAADCQTAGASLSNFCVGVIGEATVGVATVGVYGEGNNTGVWARGGSTGVYGSGSVWGAWFDGNVHVVGVLTQTSDARLKTAITPAEAGLDEILQLRPKSYAWKADPEGPRHLGLLAQDVQAVFPELVSDAGLHGESALAVNYIELIPVLISAIQEQQAMIEGLEGTGPISTASGPSGPVIDRDAGFSLAGALFGGLALVAVTVRRRGPRVR